VRFDFEDRNKQDEEIVEHYGEDGEDLKGPFVTRQQPGDKKKAEAKIHYTAEEENDLVYKRLNGKRDQKITGMVMFGLKMLKSKKMVGIFMFLVRQIC